jgi:hypothetical protein
MRTKWRSIATFHRPIHSHWSLPLTSWKIAIRRHILKVQKPVEVPFRPRSIYFCQNIWFLSHDAVPLKDSWFIKRLTMRLLHAHGGNYPQWHTYTATLSLKHPLQLPRFRQQIYTCAQSQIMIIWASFSDDDYSSPYNIPISWKCRRNIETENARIDIFIY